MTFDQFTIFSDFGSTVFLCTRSSPKPRRWFWKNFTKYIFIFIFSTTVVSRFFGKFTAKENIIHVGTVLGRGDEKRPNRTREKFSMACGNSESNLQDISHGLVNLVLNLFGLTARWTNTEWLLHDLQIYWNDSSYWSVLDQLLKNHLDGPSSA